MDSRGAVAVRSLCWLVLAVLFAGLSLTLPLNVLETSGAHVTPAILATVPGHTRPFRLAVDRTTNRIYVVSEVNIAQVINGSNNTVMATLANMPFRDVAVNHVTNCAYVGGFGIRVIDYDNTVPFTIPVNTDAVAVDPTRNLIYATTGAGLAVIDGVTHVITTIPLPLGVPGNAGYGSIAVNPVTNRVYVGDSDLNANVQLAHVIVVNRNTNTISTIPISVPGAGYAFIDDIDVNPVTNRIYVSVLDQYGVATTPRIMVIDGATNTIIAQISTRLGPFGQSGQLTVNPSTNRIHTFISTNTPGGVPLAVINGSTNAIESTLMLPFTQTPFPGCCVPLGLAANPTTDRIYVTRVDVLDVGNTAVIGEPNSSSPPGPSLTAGRCRQPSNQAPMADAGPDQTGQAAVECSSPSGATVTLNGSASSDPDGDTLTYTWTGPFGTLMGLVITPTIPLGTHTITLAVSDGKGEPVSDTVVVTVRDTTSPTLSVLPSPSPLSPANHAMIGVTATLTMSDACSSPTARLVSITSSEADSGVGSGDLAGDIQGADFNTDDRAFFLRAEGYGSGIRRVYTVTYRATDVAGNATPFVATVNVLNTQPVADAGPDQLPECAGPSGTNVTLSAAMSSDADGDPLTYAWTGAISGSGVTISGTLPIGMHTITLTVSDGKGGTATDTVVVTVRDTGLPTITLAVSPTLLWPPDHRLVEVNAAITASDLCDSTARVTLVSVVSNEPDSGLGDGDVPGDVQNASFGTDDRTISLRAERSWSGSGRVYTITYRLTDASGNQRTVTAQVTVPLGTSVSIDIYPGSFPNSVGCGSTNNLVTVAIMSTATFDATTVDADTVRFGKTGVEAAEFHRDQQGRATRHLEDVNRDGRMDLVLHFRLGLTGFGCADIPTGQQSVTLPGRLTGVTSAGPQIRGEDSLRLVGGN